MAHLQKMVKYEDRESLLKNVIDDVITSIKMYIFNIERIRQSNKRTHYQHVISKNITQSDEYVNFGVFIHIPNTIDKLNNLKDWINTKDLQLFYKIYRGIGGYYHITVSDISYDISPMAEDILNAEFNITLDTIKINEYECYFDTLNVDIMTVLLKYSPVISILSLAQVYAYQIPDNNFEVLYKENFSKIYNNIFVLHEDKKSSTDYIDADQTLSTKDLLKLDRSIPWKDHYIQMLRTYALWYNQYFLGVGYSENSRLIEDYIRQYLPDHKYDMDTINRSIGNMHQASISMNGGELYANDFIPNVIIDMSMVNLDTYFTPQDVDIVPIRDLNHNLYKSQFIRQLKLYDYMFLIIVNSEFFLGYVNMFIYYIWQYSKIYFNYIVDHMDPKYYMLTSNLLKEPDMGPYLGPEVTIQNRLMLLDIFNRRPKILSPYLSKHLVSKHISQ